ncbi:MAG: hypothetical protein A3C02_01640 [Candidatus Andersenbacteria bacterium RIFCSPHIGHO2_02_FULL_45_11]|uniref:Uncharacterized protein n=1 Tax=Candidatus Andersenbacteria bacterium RIFCSPHIGHO2_12_FULL_45_11 TaxID=1797281 RepID=A0A1G1X225_9BACT|nr:MAG: hypothetical protein A2805_02355 [Candidatus Andersenbacteria bacterium RIFCSPHIGHO2_01_FULL_46_36]OGY32761.1 MAG: hypothetical protein A3C02_01640 [Candidatus Andersenbacteria bacterium RIFCSPHIGHO2_02_FULL_45_11]OGY34066.1 MAG: hypothetical protein A3D99_02315 [Candidatus Andersenbacteria bacterium RIFCSPHIGHO2_12_FULL_45_11]
MSEKKITTCDCGCKKLAIGRKSGGWFNLDQGYGFSMDKNSTIKGTLNFSSLECLQRWIANKTKKSKVK